MNNVNSTSIQGGLVNYFAPNLVTCQSMNTFWGGVHNYINSSWQGDCEDKTTCYNGRLNKFQFLQQDENHCKMSLDSRKSDIAAHVELNGNQCSIQLMDGQNHEDSKNSIDAQTDFNTYIQADWKQINKKWTFDNNKFINSEITNRGSFKIQNNDDGSINIEFKNGETTISGNCKLGIGEISCENTNGGILSWLATGNKVKATYTKEYADNGEQIVKLELISEPNVLSALFVEQKLGNFEWRVNPQGEFSITSNIRGLDSQPILDGEFSCKNDPTNKDKADCAGKVVEFTSNGAKHSFSLNTSFENDPKMFNAILNLEEKYKGGMTSYQDQNNLDFALKCENSGHDLSCNESHKITKGGRIESGTIEAGLRFDNEGDIDSVKFQFARNQEREINDSNIFANDIIEVNMYNNSQTAS